MRIASHIAHALHAAADQSCRLDRAGMRGEGRVSLKAPFLACGMRVYKRV